MDWRAFLLLAGSAAFAQEWPAWHGGPANTKYSPLRQIDTRNVGRLALAWKYDTGDAGEGSEMQCNPLIVRGIALRDFAEAARHRARRRHRPLKWGFDPNREAFPVTGQGRNRGLNYWESGDGSPPLLRVEELALRAQRRHGQARRLLRRQRPHRPAAGLGRDVTGQTVGLTTPGVIYKDLLIIGSIVSEALPAAPGHIRAFDVRTGQAALDLPHHPAARRVRLRDLAERTPTSTSAAPTPGPAWRSTRNAASSSSPTGSAAFDFYGANRAGDNLFANCLLALDAEHRQARLALPDRPPRRLGPRPARRPHPRHRHAATAGPIDAVAQITKSGYVWVFDRDTGKPLFPYRDSARCPPPTSTARRLATTQPLPLKPRALRPPAVHRRRSSPTARREAQRPWSPACGSVRSGPQFTPPSREGTIIFPGFDGGGEWGGGTFDPGNRPVLRQRQRDGLDPPPGSERPAGGATVGPHAVSTATAPPAIDDDLDRHPARVPVPEEPRRRAAAEPQVSEITRATAPAACPASPT